MSSIAGIPLIRDSSSINAQGKVLKAVHRRSSQNDRTGTTAKTPVVNTNW
jgi:hypothetical protein